MPHQSIKTFFMIKRMPRKEKIIASAKLTNAHSSISALLEGYSTKVGEQGAQLYDALNWLMKNRNESLSGTLIKYH